MTLTTYAGLQLAIADTLDRDDLTSQIPDFIVLAEASIKRRLRTELPFLPVAQDTTLLQIAPDLYLYGACAAAAPFLEHDQRLEMWGALFEKALKEANDYVRNNAQQGAITDYTTLLSAVDNWIGGLNITGRSGQFVHLAEAEIRRRVKRRTVQEAVTFLTDASTFDLTSLSTEIDTLRTVKLQTSVAAWNRPLELGSVMKIQQEQARYQSTGRPIYAAIIGTDLHLAPVPDQDYVALITYFLKTLPVQQDATLLLESPDLYLYGALVQAAPYVKDTTLVQEWRARFETAMDQVNLQRQREEGSGAPAPLYIPNPIG